MPDTPILESEADVRRALDDRYRVLFQAHEAFNAAQRQTLVEMHGLKQLLRGAADGIPVPMLGHARSVLCSRGTIPAEAPHSELVRLAETLLDTVSQPAKRLYVAVWRVAEPTTEHDTWVRAHPRDVGTALPAGAFEVRFRPEYRKRAATNAATPAEIAAQAFLQLVCATPRLLDLLDDEP